MGDSVVRTLQEVSLPGGLMVPVKWEGRGRDIRPVFWLSPKLNTSLYAAKCLTLEIVAFIGYFILLQGRCGLTDIVISACSRGCQMAVTFRYSLA